MAVYIDDFTLLDRSLSSLQKSRSVFKAKMAQWGFLLHDAKETLPSQRFACIGYVVDTLKLSLSLAESKGKKKLLKLHRFKATLARSEGRVSFYEFESMAGSLSHAAQVVYGGRWNMRSWWDFRRLCEIAAQARRRPAARPQRSALVLLPASVLTSIDWWLQQLPSAHMIGRPLFIKPDGFLDVFDGLTFPRPWGVPVSDIGALGLTVITIDASSSGMGFVIGDPESPPFKFAMAWSVAQSATTSNWRESRLLH